MTTVYLIIWMLGYEMPISAIEFSGMKECEAARKQLIEEFAVSYNIKLKTFCVVK